VFLLEGGRVKLGRTRQLHRGPAEREAAEAAGQDADPFDWDACAAQTDATEAAMAEQQRAGGRAALAEQQEGRGERRFHVYEQAPGLRPGPRPPPLAEQQPHQAQRRPQPEHHHQQQQQQQQRPQPHHHQQRHDGLGFAKVQVGALLRNGLFRRTDTRPELSCCPNHCPNHLRRPRKNYSLAC